MGGVICGWNYSAGNIPCNEVFVECRCKTEHLDHGCDAGNIPTQGFIKSIQTIEGSVHISYFTYIPA
eukprot:scaffold105590_cov64-Attheya_sp.AAC.1